MPNGKIKKKRTADHCLFYSREDGGRGEVKKQTRAPSLQNIDKDPKGKGRGKPPRGAARKQKESGPLQKGLHTRRADPKDHHKEN